MMAERTIEVRRKNDIVSAFCAKNGILFDRLLLSLPIDHCGVKVAEFSMKQEPIHNPLIGERRRKKIYLHCIYITVQKNAKK
jgi:hypothetical protein